VLVGEVLASEYSDAMLFASSHQLSVDTYAVQHAGGAHPHKSVAIHPVGLYLVLEAGLRPTDVPCRLQSLATGPPGDGPSSTSRPSSGR
jgi:hypothetical protein